eukprot:3191680-Rhodomonas_salina.3
MQQPNRRMPTSCLRFTCSKQGVWTQQTSRKAYPAAGAGSSEFLLGAGAPSLSVLCAAGADASGVGRLTTHAVSVPEVLWVVRWQMREFTCQGQKGGGVP